MNYKPSSELHRAASERNANHIRKQAWLARSAKHRYQHPYHEKSGDLDVSSEQEPDYYQGQIDVAQANETNMLVNDPAYQEFIDNVNKTPF